MANVPIVLLAPAGIDSPLRAAHFLGQVAVETWAFTGLEEDLDYNAFRIGTVWPELKVRAAALAGNPEALANAAYADKWGNGNEASGDGWRYRGRGLLDHTFRDNYAELGSALGLPLLAQPELLLVPAHAVRAGVHFFKSRGCIERADADDTAAITRKINGGENGLAEREMLKRRALRLLENSE